MIEIVYSCFILQVFPGIIRRIPYWILRTEWRADWGRFQVRSNALIVYRRVWVPDDIRASVL